MIGPVKTKYIIMTPQGRAVQNWCFATPKHIIYCNSPEWAMDFQSIEKANQWIEYLNKNFPGQKLNAVKVTIKTIYEIG